MIPHDNDFSWGAIKYILKELDEWIQMIILGYSSENAGLVRQWCFSSQVHNIFSFFYFSNTNSQETMNTSMTPNTQLLIVT